MSDRSTHTKGLAIVALGVLVVTPDTLLIRLIGLDPWSLLVWRGFLQAVGLSLILLCFYGRGTLACFRAIGWAGLGAAVVFTFSSFFFVYALDHTSVANVLVLLATSPFFAALFSWIFLREPVPARTWGAILAALCGITLLGYGSLGSGHLVGDLAALAGAATLGAKFTVIRGARRINMVPAMALSGIIIGLVAWVIAPMPPLSPLQLTYTLLMGLLVIPIGVGLMTIGPRYLPAPEVSLLLLLETVLGPLWVWLVIGEVPSTMAIIGGSVVITALAVHSALGLRA